MLKFGISNRTVRPITLMRYLHAGSVHNKSHNTSYRLSDSTVNSDEIMSENDPWSPTLFNDIVHIRKPNSFRNTPLPSNYRLSYLALYEAPGAKYVAMLKRLSLSFAVLGCYGAKLFYESVQFDDIYAIATLISCTAPAYFVQIKTRDYVTRIFRLYDKEKPQTLENLLADEKLVMEKLNMTGGKTFNELLTITDNKSLKLVHPPRFPLLSPYASWEEVEKESDVKRKYYVVDDIGGLKMDRLWGIVENNSKVDNGRYIEPEVSADK